MTDPVRKDAATKADGPTEQSEEARQEGVRFDDAFWDDAFCAWWDPSMRICC